ncbi:hypothetical protein Tco_1168738 [Tanacetum coccineum]
MIARKRPRSHPDDEYRKCLRIITIESTIDSEIIEIKSFIARLHKVSSPDGDYLVHYSEITPEGIELILWGDLKIICNPQQKKMIKELLQRMLDLGLEVEEESAAALHLDAQDEGRTSSVVLEEKESTQNRVSIEVEVSTVKPDEGTDKSKVSTDKPEVSTAKLKEVEVSTDKPDEGTDKSKVSTDKPEVSTAKLKEVEVSTDKLDEGTTEPKDGTSVESTAPTTIFRDDETIAEFSVSICQNKDKQKGVEIKDVEDLDRPRAKSTRSVLTLKPLPKIDPKYKGKKVLEEEAESDAESEGVDEAERKFDQLAKDEEIARKARIEADRLLAARL